MLRAIFRACYNRYRECRERQGSQGAALELLEGAEEGHLYSRKPDEYLADFHLVTKRHLEAAEWAIFHLHFLCGAGWRECCRQFGLDRGTFFHTIYAIEQRLGRIYAELQPYALYPLYEYFTDVGNTGAFWRARETGAAGPHICGGIGVAE